MYKAFHMSALIEECLQHILETLNIPEVFQDWDWDNDLDVDGHLKKWNQTLREMFTMVIMQLVSNVILLLPFFVTGKILSLKSRFSSSAPLHRRLTVQQINFNLLLTLLHQSTLQGCQLAEVEFPLYCRTTLHRNSGKNRCFEISYFLRGLW